MSILDTYRKYPPTDVRKTTRTYFLVALLSILIDNVYALFGHGVRSPAVSLLFLYPLLGGSAIYLLIGLLCPCISANKKYRLFYNLYNSGLAVLMVGSLLKGILDIAGTASPYIAGFFITGLVFTTAGLVLFAIMAAGWPDSGQK